MIFFCVFNEINILASFYFGLCVGIGLQQVFASMFDDKKSQLRGCHWGEGGTNILESHCAEILKL